MEFITLSNRELNSIIELLKKIKRIGETCTMINDIVRCSDFQKNVIGSRHYLTNYIIELPKDVAYNTVPLTDVVRALDIKKGLIESISMRVSMDSIDFMLNGDIIHLASRIALEGEVSTNSDLDVEIHWEELPYEVLETLRCNEHLEYPLMYDAIDYGFLKMAKNIFPEFGSNSRAVQFSSEYHIDRMSYDTITDPNKQPIMITFKNTLFKCGTIVYHQYVVQLQYD